MTWIRNLCHKMQAVFFFFEKITKFSESFFDFMYYI